MFSLTPIEAAIWTTGVSIQTELSLKFFGGIAFVSLLVVVFGYRIYGVLTSSDSEGQTARNLFVAVAMVILGMMFLRTVDSTPFSPVDSEDRPWGTYRYVKSDPTYSSLQYNHEGLYWYRVLHGAGTGVSKFMTNVITMIFENPGYPRSPYMLFKVLLATANVEMDDPRVAASLDRLVNECTDTSVAKVLGPRDSINLLFDLENEDCKAQYKDLQGDLKGWARRRMPGYLKAVKNAPPEELEPSVRRFVNSQALSNKVVASALTNYARTKTGGRDFMNTNLKELGLTDRWDKIWFQVQRLLSGGALPSLFFNQEGESAVVRNEIGAQYNNLLNLVPTIKGYVKLFICLAFMVAAAALACGHVGLFQKWVVWVGLDALYEPATTLNYHLWSFWMRSKDVGMAFGDLSGDPMAMMGAALIDSESIRMQTGYYITQLVLTAALVFGIIGSGWVIRGASFAQGLAFGAFAKSALGSRILSKTGGSIVRRLQR